MTTYLNAVDDTVRWAYRQPQNSVYRRMEIYEADCVTQWFPSIGTERLIGGSINLSYDRDERRQLNSLQIANFDGILSRAVLRLSQLCAKDPCRQAVD